MRSSFFRRVVMPATALGLAAPLIVSGPVGAVVTRTSGSGQNIDVSWTEYDPDDLLGLPGNVHIGYLYADSGPYGSYVSGSVSDFDCDEGETPWGGGGHGIAEEIVDDGAEAVATATVDAIEAVADSNESVIDAADVVAAVQSELDDAITDTIADEFEEYPACDYIQDRFLDGTGTTTLTVDTKAKVARITGTLTVTNGGHGEPGNVLATPPVDITIRGGEWEQYEYSWKVRGRTYRYSDWQKGTRYYGGTVTGRVGAMGLADDADDASYGGFTSYRYRTVERVR